MAFLTNIIFIFLMLCLISVLFIQFILPYYEKRQERMKLDNKALNSFLKKMYDKTEDLQK